MALTPKRVRPKRDPSPTRRTSTADHMAPAILARRRRWHAPRPRRSWLPVIGLTCFTVSALYAGVWLALIIAGVSCFLAERIYDPDSGAYSGR